MGLTERKGWPHQWKHQQPMPERNQQTTRTQTDHQTLEATYQRGFWVAPDLCESSGRRSTLWRFLFPLLLASWPCWRSLQMAPSQSALLPNQRRKKLDWKVHYDHSQPQGWLKHVLHFMHSIVILLKCTMAILSFRADRNMHCTLRKSKFIRLFKFVKSIPSFRAD